MNFTAQLDLAVNVVAASTFSVTLMLLNFMSMLDHALPTGRAKHWFARLDYVAIYVFIAGSYSPFALGVLHGSVAWPL